MPMRLPFFTAAGNLARLYSPFAYALGKKTLLLTSKYNLMPLVLGVAKPAIAKSASVKRTSKVYPLVASPPVLYALTGNAPIRVSVATPLTTGYLYQFNVPSLAIFKLISSPPAQPHIL